jgi:hypothetical protein
LLIEIGDWSQFGLLAVPEGGLISPKLALGMLSFSFTIVFMIQHFLYQKKDSDFGKKVVVLHKIV